MGSPGYRNVGLRVRNVSVLRLRLTGRLAGPFPRKLAEYPFMLIVPLAVSIVSPKLPVVSVLTGPDRLIPRLFTFTATFSVAPNGPNRPGLVRVPVGLFTAS